MNQLRDITVDDLIKVKGTPLVLNVDAPKVPVQSWIECNQPDIERLLHGNGALLIRGLQFLGTAQLASALRTLFGAGLVPYTYRSTPRTHFKGNIYTATEYHSSETIPQHNENSYSNLWPLWIGFLCVTPPLAGGRTPIADSRVVYDRIPEKIRNKFESKRIMYTRNHGAVDLPWTEVFQTEQRDDVERYCRDNGIAWSWTGSDGLQTRQVGDAAALHPTSNEKVWFNQAHLFHITNVSEEHRGQLLAALNGQPPRDAHYGDGSPIDVADLDCIRKIYDEAALSVEWQRGDLLLLDNMLFSHGREPYEGARKILCGMAGTHGPNPKA